MRSERVRARHGNETSRVQETATDPRRSIEARLTLDAVQAELQSLDPEQRAVLVLVCVEGQSYAQAAATLGVPVGTVTSRLGRARAHLKHVLYDEPGV
ncbi:MAG: RNA polymerase sigma factor [Alphaproteobacteria bacterium]